MSRRTIKGDPDLAEWCKALASCSRPPEVVSLGWQTAQQISQQTKVPLPTLQQKLKRLVESGLAEKRSFTIKLAAQTRPVPHYRLK